MYELPANIVQSVKRYKSVELDGLTFHPVCVDEYDSFLMARAAIDFLPQSLKMPYITMPLLSAYYKIDYDLLTSGNQITGLFTRAILSLALALRLGRNETIEQRLQRFMIIGDAGDESKLRSINFEMDGEIKSITPSMFGRFRVLFAAQNGIELESEDANPELVEAERIIASKRMPNLRFDVADEIAAVSCFGNVSEDEIYEWPIAKLMKRSEIIRRVIDYTICGIGEAQGTTWSGGNPFPHPFFALEKKGTSALVSADKFANGAAKDALNNPNVKM